MSYIPLLIHSVVNIFECLNAVHITAAAVAACKHNILRYVLLGVRRESPKLLISVKRVVYFFFFLFIIIISVLK